jgi:hypothetical protein
MPPAVTTPVSASCVHSPLLDGGDHLLHVLADARTEHTRHHCQLERSDGVRDRSTGRRASR